MKRFIPQGRPKVPNHQKKVTGNEPKKTNGRASPGHPEQPSDPDLINNLNDDCLAKIFKYLPMDERLRLEEVCKRWKDVTKLAWDDIKMLIVTPYHPVEKDLLKLPDASRTNQCIGRIIKKCGLYLHRMVLTEPCRPTILPLVAQHCHNLVRLEIELVNYGKSCAKLCSQMQRLKYLDIKRIMPHFPGEFFIGLPQSLTEVHLWAHVPLVQLSTSIFLPRVAPHALRCLTNLTALTLDGFSLKPNMIKIISQMPGLTFLSIANCTLRTGLPSLELLKKLQHLDLTKAVEVDNNYLRDIIDNCSNLKYLNLSNCPNVDNTGINSLMELSHLEELVLNDVFQITGAAFVEMYNLKKLDCKGCHSVCNEGILSFIKYSANLEYLNLAYTGVDDGVIHEANEATKTRTNNLQLHLVVSSSVKEMWYENEEDYSPLLFVQGTGIEFHDVSDSDFDMDYYDSGEDDYDDIYHDGEFGSADDDEDDFEEQYAMYFPNWI